MAKLIIDSRETNVTRHVEELAGVPIIRRLITIGDYAVVDAAGRILISVERKSLEDYAASIKDGRISNIEKMVKLREETGCRLILLIEGKPRAKHGGIPYKAIESSMWHVALRHHVILLFTKSTVETASLLARLVTSVDKMQSGHSPIIPINMTRVVDNEPDTPSAADVRVGGAQESVPDALVVVHAKSTHDISRSILAVIGGITTDSADEYLAKYSAMDILRGVDISGIKFASGRSPTSRVIKGINEARRNPAIWQKMLSRVPRITPGTAQEILKHGTLPALLTWSAEALGVITIAVKKDGNNVRMRKLTASVAARLLECFRFNLNSGI